MKIYKNYVMIASDKQEIYLFDKCMFYVITKVSSFTWQHGRYSKYTFAEVSVHDIMEFNSSYLNRAFEAIYLHLFLKSSDGVLWVFTVSGYCFLRILVALGRHGPVAHMCRKCHKESHPTYPPSFWPCL